MYNLKTSFFDLFIIKLLKKLKENRKVKVKIYFENETMENSDFDLSLVAGNIVTNTLQLTRNLFCPYCAGAFLFEFTLKEHLKRTHQELILTQLAAQNSQELNLSLLSQEKLHNCPFCGAAFVHLGLIPKHIKSYHGNDLFNIWKQQDGNLERMEVAKELEPSIMYAEGSPGLSDIFERIHTNSQSDTETKNTIDQPQLKSILKKTPTKNRIICSPSSAAIRRTKSDAVRRSLSVRRELRFDPTVKNNRSPPSDQQQSPALLTEKEKLSFFKLKNPFARKHLQPKSVNNQLVTSTPINFLDDDPIGSQAMNRKYWRASIRNNQPLFFSLERYQCAFCRKTWENNADLLMHLSDHHRGVRRWLRPQYRCSQCGVTFYSNFYLVKHCHQHHSPGGKLIRRNTIR